MDTSEIGTLVRAITITAGGFLGEGEKLRSITTELLPNQSRARIWAELRDNSPAGQLEAVSNFFSVQDCYADELELELHFGEGFGPVEDARADNMLQLSY